MSEHAPIASPLSAWPLMTALVLLVAACDGSTVAPVEEILPGSITVTTTTSGFMKDDGFELMVDGESAGTIGADDETTIPDLDPGTYEVALGDVAENCEVESTSVEVVSEETAEVSLEVVCSGESQAYTIQYGRERPNLDDGSVLECPFSICSTNEGWDLYVHNNTQTDPHAVIRQNQTTSVEIAHLAGVTLDALTEEDVAGADFLTSLIADPFDADRVILIRTDEGNLFALGNPVEDNTANTLTFDAVLVAGP